MNVAEIRFNDKDAPLNITAAIPNNAPDNKPK